MAAEVKVVGQADGEAIAKVALHGQIGLLRIGVDKVLGLRVAEGLEPERQEGSSGKVEVILVEENGLRNV